MTTAPADPGQGGPRVPTGFDHELDDLSRRIRTARDQGADPDPVLLQDLETAYEELRVADEEVRAQQEQIATLLESRQLMRWQQERTMSLLPLPALITNEDGVVEFVNAAAAMMLNMRVARIVGKPLLVFFSRDDRPALRRMLSTTKREQGAFRHTATLLGRQAAPVAVECAVSVLPGAGKALSWSLLSTASAHAARDAALPEALAGIAALLLHHQDEKDLLRAAAQVSDEVLGPDVCLSLVIGTPLEPEVLASTAQLAQSADGAQITAGEGPCATAFETAEVVVATDVCHDPRWPQLARILDPDLVGVVAVPLEVGDRVVGALNVYTREPVRPELVGHAELLASTTAAVLHELGNRRQLEDLTREMEAALTSRATIEQAKGIIIAHRGVGPDEAFAHLVSLSSSRHLKLREVAAQIVAEAATDSSR